MEIVKTPKMLYTSNTFQVVPEQFKYEGAGTVGKNHLISNALKADTGYQYNGSGDKAFGGAKQWPRFNLNVAFQEGQEALCEEVLEDVLQYIVEKYFKD